jgi:hypothetical protein
MNSAMCSLDILKYWAAGTGIVGFVAPGGWKGNLVDGHQYDVFFYWRVKFVPT